MHVPSLLLGRLLDRGEVTEVLVEPIEESAATLGMGLSFLLRKRWTWPFLVS